MGYGSAPGYADKYEAVDTGNVSDDDFANESFIESVYLLDEKLRGLSLADDDMVYDGADSLIDDALNDEAQWGLALLSGSDDGVLRISRLAGDARGDDAL